MDFIIETFIPHTTATATEAELPEVYAKLPGEAASATVQWNADGDNGLIVAVGEDYSYVTLQHDGDFYTLTVKVESDNADEDEDDDEVLLIGGADTTVAKNQIASRELGLAVLQKAPDIPGLLTEYTWEEQ